MVYKTNCHYDPKHCLVYLALSFLCVSVSANYHYERTRAFTHYGSDDVFRKPWSFSGYDEPYEFASSDHSPSYRYLPRVKEEENIAERGIFHSTDNFNSPKEFLSTSSTKKIPREDKNFKKVLSPFYTITGKDSEKYKDIVMKSGAPYCVEIKETGGKTEKGGKEGITTCYKCKNPKDGSTYEQCSYVSRPSKKSASTRIESFVIPPPNFRYKRLASEDDDISFKHKNNNDYRRHDNPYRFDDKILADTTHDIPVEYKNKDEKCERIVKDSMVCMVCKDAKTNGKYEQCSYVHQPNEKSYSYSKSSSFKNPGLSNKQDENSRSHDDHKHSETKPVKEHQEYSYPKNEYNNEKKFNEQSDKEHNTDESSGNCKQIEKDSQTCMVCKDPKTGGNYEKCSYAYQPNDKIYKFSKSKSFGYPRASSSEESKKSEKDDDKSYEAITDHSDTSSEYSSDYSIPESFYSKPEKSRSSSYYGEDEPSSSYIEASSSDSKTVSKPKNDDYYKSESEKESEKVDSSNCKKVQKDSMTCDVCKDPKTGTNYERCSYNYKPSDKLYSYTKSRSYGSPTETASSSESNESDKSKEAREPSSNERKGYGIIPEQKSHTAASDVKREFQDYPLSSESKSNAKQTVPDKKETTTTSKVDANFYDALKKKEEIEKVLQEFQKEDRSNCKKVMRDKMTCYQCVDEKGFQKEECAFITAAQPEKDKFIYREVKEYQADPSKKIKRSERRVDDIPLEPETSASENVQTKQVKPVREESAEQSAVDEESKGVDAYDYAAETKPVYDKVLGLTLPAYMLERTEHEAEFDEAVAASRF